MVEENKVTFGISNMHVAFIGQSQTGKIEVTDPPGTDGEIEIEVTADDLLGVDSPQAVVVPLASETHTNAAKVGGGRVAGIPHIRPAYDKFVPKMEKDIEKIIKSGG